MFPMPQLRCGTRSCVGSSNRCGLYGEPPSLVGGIPPPYVIAIVELTEDTSVRLTTNIVESAGADIYVGMPVEVDFEEWGSIWDPSL